MEKPKLGLAPILDVSMAGSSLTHHATTLDSPPPKIFEEIQINLTPENQYHLFYNTLIIPQNILWEILVYIKSGAMHRPFHILISPIESTGSYFSLFFKLQCMCTCPYCVLGSMVTDAHGLAWGSRATNECSTLCFAKEGVSLMEYIASNVPWSSAWMTL